MIAVGVAPAPGPGAAADDSGVAPADVLALEAGPAPREATRGPIAAERRYEEIFALAGELIVLLDRDGRVTDVNPAAERTLGYSRGQIVGARSPRSCRRTPRAGSRTGWPASSPACSRRRSTRRISSPGAGG